MRQLHTKRSTTLTKLLCALFVAFAVLLVPALALAEEDGAGATAQADYIAMLRVYNPNTGEHFFTSDESESGRLVQLGWVYEGVAWYAPTDGDPVHRLYNVNTGEHHYTTDYYEMNTLRNLGWRYEGTGWYSQRYNGVPIFREYNPNAWCFNHNYTASWDEHTTLLRYGWRDEGIAWGGVWVQS